MSVLVGRVCAWCMKPIHWNSAAAAWLPDTPDPVIGQASVQCADGGIRHWPTGYVQESDVRPVLTLVQRGTRRNAPGVADLPGEARKGDGTPSPA